METKCLELGVEKIVKQLLLAQGRKQVHGVGAYVDIKIHKSFRKKNYRNMVAPLALRS